MAKRNDISSAVIYKSFLGKWIAFTSKDYANNEEMPNTSIIACEQNKSSLYVNNAVVQHSNRIALMDEGDTNERKETLIIHYVDYTTPAQNDPDPMGDLLGVLG